MTPPGAPVPTPSNAIAWLCAVTLSIAYIAGYLGVFGVNILLPEIQSSLGVSDATMGLGLGAAFSLPLALAGLFWGWVSDRASRRYVIAAGLLVVGMSAIGTLLAHSAAAFIASRVLAGIGVAAIAPAAVPILAQAFAPNRLATPIGLFSIGPKAGSALALAASGILLALFARQSHLSLGLAPWQMTLATGVVAPLVAGLLALTIWEPRRVGPAQGGEMRAALRFLLARADLFLPMLVGFGLMLACGESLLAWVPTYIRRRFEWQPGTYGPILGLIGLGGAAIAVIKGAIVDRLFSRGMRDSSLRFYTWLLFGTYPVVIASFLVTTAPQFLLLYAVVGTVAIPSLLYAYAAIQLTAPAFLRGRVLACFLLPLAVIAGLGPLTVGFLTDRVFCDKGAVGTSLGVFLALAIPLAAIALRRALPRLSSYIPRDHAADPVPSPPAL